MMKSNPLFHDSTVSQGANIQTQFELTGVDLKDRHVLCLKLIVGNEVRCIEMSLKSKGVYQTSAWIKHRKRISYRFFIQMGGELLYASEMKTSLALHTVSETWQPLEGTDWKNDFQKLPDAEKMDMGFVESSKKQVSQDEYLDNLIDKWDL